MKQKYIKSKQTLHYNKHLYEIISIFLFLFMLLISYLFIKEYHYPNWGNGEKVIATNGIITNRYIDKETGDVYSCINYYDSNNELIEKWFRVDLKGKENIDVYYVVNNPLEKSRLTSPYNLTKIYTCSILFLLFFILEFVFLHKIIKIRKK